MHARSLASQHLSNTGNLVVLSQNESLASDSEGLQTGCRNGQPMTLQQPGLKQNQGISNTNQLRHMSSVLSHKGHHPNQDVVLEELEEDKPIEENKDLILPDEMVNYLHEVAEQSQRPPSVISEAVTSVSRYVPPSSLNVNKQPIKVQNSQCLNHAPPQQTQSWSCTPCCQNHGLVPHCMSHSCKGQQQHCQHNHMPVPNAGPQTVQPCCYTNTAVQQLSCHNEVPKPLQHSGCPDSIPMPNGNYSNVPYNQNVMPYGVTNGHSIPHSNSGANFTGRNQCYSQHSFVPDQQSMNSESGFTDPHFNVPQGPAQHSHHSSPPFTQNGFPHVHNQTNVMSPNPYVGNMSMQHGNDNQMPHYPSQRTMTPTGYGPPGNTHHLNCPPSNYNTPYNYNSVNKHSNQMGHVSQMQMPYNTQSSVSHQNNSLPFNQEVGMNSNLQVQRSESTNPHSPMNYTPQVNACYNSGMWCNNQQMGYNAYNSGPQMATYNKEGNTNVPLNQNSTMHPYNQGHLAQPTFNAPSVCGSHNLVVNGQCTNSCTSYSQMQYGHANVPAQYPNQQSSLPMQYSQVPNQYHEEKTIKSNNVHICANSNIANNVNSVCKHVENQWPNLPHGEGNHCCNHKLGTSIQAQHSASSISEQDEKETSVSAAIAVPSSHGCPTDQREIQCQNVSQSSLSGMQSEAYQRTLKYVQQCQELLGKQQASPSCNRVSSSTDRQSPAVSHSPLLQTSNMVINDLNSGLHSLVEETRYLQLLH